MSIFFSCLGSAQIQNIFTNLFLRILILNHIGVCTYVYYSNLNCAGWEMRGNRNPASVNNYRVFSGRTTILASIAQNLNSFKCSHPLPRWLSISPI